MVPFSCQQHQQLQIHPKEGTYNAHSYSCQMNYVPMIMQYTQTGIRSNNII
jgi:hypothetical protein